MAEHMLLGIGHFLARVPCRSLNIGPKAMPFQFGKDFDEADRSQSLALEDL
jgi:hypothetical protein